MSADIVERLRYLATTTARVKVSIPLMREWATEAADTIEQLRTELAAAQAVVAAVHDWVESDIEPPWEICFEPVKRPDPDSPTGMRFRYCEECTGCRLRQCVAALDAARATERMTTADAYLNRQADRDAARAAEGES